VVSVYFVFLDDAEYGRYGWRRRSWYGYGKSTVYTNIDGLKK